MQPVENNAGAVQPVVPVPQGGVSASAAGRGAVVGQSSATQSSAVPSVLPVPQGANVQPGGGVTTTHSK